MNSINAINPKRNKDEKLRNLKTSKFTPLDIEIFNGAWQEARKLTNMIFDITDVSRITKKYRFTSQIESAAVSVMNNIAEGFSRKSNKEFTQFLFISKGSTAEVQSMLYIALDREYIQKEYFDNVYEQADKTARMISNFIKYLRK